MASSATLGSSGAPPVTLPQVPGRPSLRSSAVNAVAVIPLLSNDHHNNGQDDPSTYSSKSFHDLMDSLRRYNQKRSQTGSSSDVSNDELLLVVPNSNLTRPGDWKYDSTPLKNFHWGFGCQRLQIFDGRPYNSRMAHDRLMNHGVTRDWIDLCPSRRTAAVIGVLNLRDCPDAQSLKHAEEEWRQWADRYSTPPYEVTAHGRDCERDVVVQRLFVFDSFHESTTVSVDDLTTFASSRVVAFPPSDEEHTHMMDLHMNVVIPGLAVSIFLQLEERIRECDAFTGGVHGSGNNSGMTTPSKAASLFFRSSSDKEKDKDRPQASSDLSLNTIASVVSPENKLAAASSSSSSSSRPTLNKVASFKAPSLMTTTPTPKLPSSAAKLLTPVDDVWDFAELSPKDAQGMVRRDVGRRQKFAADLSLLAGSPMDAYERYTKAAELCKTSTPDPLWYASALEGCAAAHISMAEIGGYNVDQYLEASFQLPEEFMACAVLSSSQEKQRLQNKQTLPRVVSALCEEALNITNRHPKLASLHAELLLKLAWYTADVEDVHLQCRWGLGDEGCYEGGENENEKSIDNDSSGNIDMKSDKTPTVRRWEKSTVTQMNYLDLKTKDGEDLIAVNTLQRCQKWTDWMHRAASCGGLDPVTRADVSLRCAYMCLKGLRPTGKPTELKMDQSRIQFRRKASFFTVMAAEALSEIEGEVSNDRNSMIWLQASKLYSSKGNSVAESGCAYGWAALRAAVLHSITLQSIRDTSENTSEDAALDLLSLMSQISPNEQQATNPGSLSNKLELSHHESPGALDMTPNKLDLDDDSSSYIGAESVVSAARSYVRSRAQDARARGANFFNPNNAPSSLLAVAQSKWADDDPIPPVVLPLEETTEFAHSVLALRCVWPTIRFESGLTAQKKVIAHIIGLRKDLPTSSLSDTAKSENSRSSSSPIRIASAYVVHSGPKEEFDRVKVKVSSSQSTSSSEQNNAMATFYNPFDNKKKKVDAQTTLVAEGEERYVKVEFNNKLFVPLEVPRCQLKFDLQDNDRIKAPAMSFVIPGRAKKFAVQFPFIILPSCSGDTNSTLPSIFEVKGFQVTCMNRSYFLPIVNAPTQLPAAEKERILPNPASMYTRRNYHKKNNTNDERVILPPRIEVLPCQPNLLVTFAQSQTPIGESTIVPAPLSDGETFTVPTFHLQTDSGPSGFGKVEAIRITAHGLPKQPEVQLFDTSKDNVDAEKSEESSQSPLVLLATCENMDLATLNDNGEGLVSHSTITIKITASRDMGARLSSGCTLRIRFRYKGTSPAPEMEIWRKSEVQIRVIRVKGPRISSLTFRPDLSSESSFPQLCRSLALQNPVRALRPKSTGANKAINICDVGGADPATVTGLVPGVNVCDSSTVVFLSVANETNSAILLSSSSGIVGGFNNSPIATMRVSSGVSVKIPIIIPRLDRSMDICSQLVEKTTLNWRSESVMSDDIDLNNKLETGGTMQPVNRRTRRGQMKIPRGCLEKIILANPTSLSRICKSPLSTLKVNIKGQRCESGAAHVQVVPGKAVDPTISVEVSDWLPSETINVSTFIVELCCAPRDLLISKNKVNFMWCGQVAKTLPVSLEEKKFDHDARIIFLEKGRYVVSACVRIWRNGAEVEEVWWANKVCHVKVTENDASQ